MVIYDIVFGVDHGQVQCVFHNDKHPSAGIGPNGQYNCFVCGTKSANASGFIANYFGRSYEWGAKVNKKLNHLQNYAHARLPLTDEQHKYLRLDLQLSHNIINKYFFRSSVGKLMYHHIWAGHTIGYTWFNDPKLSNWNKSASKYKYDKNIIGGMLSPYDEVLKYNTLIITEGEKDMLRARSLGIINAVAKIGGAATNIVAGLNIKQKRIVLIYDCDEPGRKGALKDATNLTLNYGCAVKIIDLELKDGEDLFDYFTKYKYTTEDLYDLIKATPIHVPIQQEQLTPKSKLQRFIDSLDSEEYEKLKNIIKEKENKTWNKKQD